VLLSIDATPRVVYEYLKEFGRFAATQRYSQPSDLNRDLD